MGLRKKPPKKQGLLASILSMFGGSKKSKKKSSGSKGKSSHSSGPKKGPRRPPAERPVVRQPEPVEALDEAIFETVGLLPDEPPMPEPVELPVAPVFAPSTPPPPPTDDKQSLFPGGVDDSLDALFDSFESGGMAPPPPPPPPAAPPRPPVAAPTPPSPPAPPRPPAPPAPPRAPQSGPPPTAGQQDGLVSIGKLLIDQNTLKRIIDKAEKSGTGMYTTTKVISTTKGQDIDSLLGGIDRVDGVTGSLVVGRDGLVIASTLPDGMDRELVGAIASSLFSNSDVQCKKMNLGGLHQAILETEQGVLIMLSVDVGVLVVLSQDFGNLDLTQVLMAINATAA